MSALSSRIFGNTAKGAALGAMLLGSVAAPFNAVTANDAAEAPTDIHDQIAEQKVAPKNPLLKETSAKTALPQKPQFTGKPVTLTYSFDATERDVNRTHAIASALESKVLCPVTIKDDGFIPGTIDVQVGENSRVSTFDVKDAGGIGAFAARNCKADKYVAAVREPT